MSRPSRPAAVGAGVLAVVAVVSAVVVATRGVATDASDARHPLVAETAAQTGGLVLTSETLGAEGGQLSLVLAVRNTDSRPVLVTAVQGAGAGLSAHLPGGGMRIAGGGQATMTLAWAGPDCSTDPPDRIVGDLSYTAADLGGATADGTLVTLAADDLLQQTWRDTCEGADVSPTGVDAG